MLVNEHDPFANIVVQFKGLPMSCPDYLLCLEMRDYASTGGFDCVVAN